MGKDKEGMIRLRVLFEDHLVLNNTQISDAHGRCWVLLQPTIVTVADLASHLRDKFAIPNRLVLFIDDFVLPPFESICIINFNEIIRVKLEDAFLPSDGQNVAQDPQIARAHDTMTDEESKKNSQENGSNENAVHGGNFSLGIGVLEQKREHSPELCNSVSKRQKLNCTRKQVPSVGVHDIHSGQNRTFCHENVGSKMELPVKDKTHDDGLVFFQPDSEVSLGEPSISEASLGEPSIFEVSLGEPSSSAPCKGRPESKGMNNALESELHIACDVTKENVQSSSGTNKNDQNKFITMTFKGRNYFSDDKKKDSNGFCMENHALIDRNLDGNSSANKAKAAEHKIDFAKLFPLTRSPMRGDILAYRYVEPSSMVYPMVSLPQVGKVKAFDHKSSEIVLIPAPEFEVFLEENSKTPASSQISSLYKGDGSIEIKLSALIDVRLLRAHNSKELASLPQETVNRAKKDKLEMDLKTNNWDQSDAQHSDQNIGWDSCIPNNSTNTPFLPYKEYNIFPRGRANGAEHTASDRRASKPWFHGGSPAAALFWETVRSKGAFGSKGSNSSSSGKS